MCLQPGRSAPLVISPEDLLQSVQEHGTVMHIQPIHWGDHLHHLLACGHLFQELGWEAALAITHVSQWDCLLLKPNAKRRQIIICPDLFFFAAQNLFRIITNSVCFDTKILNFSIIIESILILTSIFCPLGVSNRFNWNIFVLQYWILWGFAPRLELALPYSSSSQLNSSRVLCLEHKWLYRVSIFFWRVKPLRGLVFQRIFKEHVLIVN